MKKTAKPHSGIYSGELVYQTYSELFDEVGRFIPDHKVAGMIPGTKERMRAKAEILVNKAKSLLAATKTV